MTNTTPVAYDFAVLRVVPHVHLGEFTPIGVILHARTAEFLGIRVLSDPRLLREWFPGLDHELLARYLRTYEEICAGSATAGPIAMEPLSERFHWLTAPRSDVLQTSSIHEGISDEPAKELESLYQAYVVARLPPPGHARA